MLIPCGQDLEAHRSTGIPPLRDAGGIRTHVKTLAGGLPSHSVTASWFLEASSVTIGPAGVSTT